MLLFLFGKNGKKAIKVLAIVIPVMMMISFLSASPTNGAKSIVVWKLNDTASVNGVKPVVLGKPEIIQGNKMTSLMFDGIDDGLIVPINPLQRLKHFTVEVLFKPAVSDSTAPRMIHIQDEEGNRCTIELRITK